MTMAPTEQRPQECKHFNQWTCGAHDKAHPCVFSSVLANPLKLYCPDFTPKPEKDGK